MKHCVFPVSRLINKLTLDLHMDYKKKRIFATEKLWSCLSFWGWFMSINNKPGSISTNEANKYKQHSRPLAVPCRHPSCQLCLIQRCWVNTLTPAFKETLRVCKKNKTKKQERSAFICKWIQLLNNADNYEMSSFLIAKQHIA